MCGRVRAGLILGIAVVLLCIVAAGQARAAIPFGDGTGVVTGRIYIDFNDNGMYDAFDVPLSTAAIDLFSGLETDAEGIYTIADLPPGPYTVFLGQGPCADFLMNDWLGVYVLGFCPIQDLPDPEVEIVAGTTVTADVPLPAFDGSANARLWLGGEAAPDGTPVSVVVDGGLCREGEVDQTQSGEGVIFSEFFIEVPPDAPECQGESVSLEVGGEVLRSWTWYEFWLAEWMDWWYEGDYWSRLNVAEPPIFGVYGRIETDPPVPTIPPGPPANAPGDVRAVIDGRLCSDSRPVVSERFYGLIVVDETTRFGCGTTGRDVIFCAGDELMSTPRQWHEEYGSFLDASVTGAPCPPLQTADMDCDLDADAVDAFGILRLVAGFDAIAADCWNPGDVDCDGDRDPVDALVVLKDLGGLPTGLAPDCYSFMLG